jgi:hypothetical protein
MMNYRWILFSKAGLRWFPSHSRGDVGTLGRLKEVLPGPRKYLPGRASLPVRD